MYDTRVWILILEEAFVGQRFFQRYFRVLPILLTECELAVVSGMLREEVFVFVLMSWKKDE